MDRTACKKCTEILPKKVVKQGKPCPNCGSKLRSYHMKMEKGEFKLTGYPVLFKTTKQVVKKYPIISTLYFFLMGISMILGWVIPGLVGIFLSFPLAYFIHKFGEEKDEVYNKEEIH